MQLHSRRHACIDPPQHPFLHALTHAKTFLFVFVACRVTEYLLWPEIIRHAKLRIRRRFVRTRNGRRLSRRRPNSSRRKRQVCILPRRLRKTCQLVPIRNRFFRLRQTHSHNGWSAYLRLPRRRGTCEPAPAPSSSAPASVSASRRLHRVRRQLHCRNRSAHLLRWWRGSPSSRRWYGSNGI